MKSPIDFLPALCDELRRARVRSDALFTTIGEARMTERPIPDRHRFVFYRGHLEAFDGNLLRSHVRNEPERRLDRLFAFGIDPDRTELPNDKVEDWPVLADVHAYAMETRTGADRVLDDALRSGDGANQSAGKLCHLLHIAIEHRLMHVETLAYMLTQSAAGIRIPGSSSAASAATAAMLPIPAGVATLGTGMPESGGFAWDNEFEAHEVEVARFEISALMVSNADYMDFVEAGGYARAEFWSDADWRWRCAEALEHPRSWRREDAGWCVCTVDGAVPMQPGWPVYVSHSEASAYARWRGLALPTEAQWQRAAYGGSGDGERTYPWGDATPEGRHGNFDFRCTRPQPVQSCPDGDSPFGVRGMLGNGWEWTKSIFAPFPGFRASPFYPGYSRDFFDGAHYVLKGGSAFTAQRFLRRSFRNWYRPHYPYVFAGFRCVRNLHD